MAKGRKKEVSALVKLQVPGGECTPAPPVGPALGQHGANIGEFVKRFNEATSAQKGILLPVVITIYTDRSFDFIVKQPPASTLIKMAAGIAKGAKNSKEEKVGSLTRAQLAQIAKQKMPDLNTSDPAAAARMLEGTARNMGVTISD